MIPVALIKGDKYMRIKSLIGVGCLIACMVLPSAVFAQDYAPVEVFGGLSVMRVSEMKVDSYPIFGSGGMTGWGASIAFNLNPNWAIKADFSGQYAKIGDSDYTLNRNNILGGVQYNIPVNDSFNVFVEGLAGFANFRLNGESLNGIGIAAGGGVDWKFSDRFAWRVAQMNYTFARASHSEWEDQSAKVNGFRFQTGILIYLGK